MIKASDFCFTPNSGHKTARAGMSALCHQATFRLDSFGLRLEAISSNPYAVRL